MKSTFRFLILFTFLFSGINLESQELPFEIGLKSVNIQNLGGIQSYAFGQANGKILIAGGRLDGLHRRQPWASFDIAGHNNQLIVIDPKASSSWSATLINLPIFIQEQLSSTNMQFIQEGDFLYCIGGYGYSATLNDHVTYDNLTAINVPGVIDSIVNGKSFNSQIRQIADPEFQITGGKLQKMYDKYYLLGGQKFMGRYNPMGPNHGPGFIQEYTNAIKSFEIIDDGISISIIHHGTYTDSSNLHRRDYNAEPQILPNGEQAITMFSGVFQEPMDLPYLNAVTMDSSWITVHNDFQQYYNHYHCPVIPMYSGSLNEMYNTFFGGIAQFYDDNGTMVQDNNVPFVNTIATVKRDANNDLSEHKMDVVMPALLGAGAEFIPIKSISQFQNGVIMFDSLFKNTDSILIGYIFGGINSTAPNIFFINDGTQSTANNEMYEVFITKKPSLSIAEDLNTETSFNFVIYPNPTSNAFNIELFLPKKDDIRLRIYDSTGKIIQDNIKNDLKIGKNIIHQKINKLGDSKIYIISIESSTEQITRKLILEE